MGETCGTFHRVYIWITSVMRNVGSTWIDAGGRAFRTYRQVCRSRRHLVSGAGLRRRHEARRQAEPTQVSRCRGVSILGPISAWQLNDPIRQKRTNSITIYVQRAAAILIRIDVRARTRPSAAVFPYIVSRERSHSQRVMRVGRHHAGPTFTVGGGENCLNIVIISKYRNNFKIS